SANNDIEMFLKYSLESGKMPEVVKTALENLHILKDGKFNISDRFVAIMSGTTLNGNSFPKVWQAIHKYGLIAEEYLPFGGSSIQEYLGAKITDEMLKKGQEFKKYIAINYEVVTYDNNQEFTKEQIEATEKALKQSPLHVATPVPAYHA